MVKDHAISIIKPKQGPHSLESNAALQTMVITESWYSEYKERMGRILYTALGSLEKGGIKMW